MLVVSNKRLVPVQINTTVLQGEDGNYYYLHRDLYDQLTVLWDVYHYGEQMHTLAHQVKESLNGYETWPENIKRFYDTVPAPLKAAAPFLALVEHVEELETIEDMCGALTVISMSINMRRLPLVARELRAALSFSLHVREEYKPQWDRFFQENPEFGTAVSLPEPRSPIVQMPQPGNNMIVVDEDTGDEEEIHYTSDPSSFDFEKMMADLTADLPSSSAIDEPADSGEPAAAATAGGGSGFDLLNGI